MSDVGPCEGCRHFERCNSQELACAALELFRNAERLSPIAPRQPSKVIFERMVNARPRRTAAERQRIRENLRRSGEDL
jgi:hypothetical protein